MSTDSKRQRMPDNPVMKLRFIWVPRGEWFIGSSRLQHIRWWQFGPIQLVYEGKPWGEK